MSSGNELTWVRTGKNLIPDNAVQGGFESDGRILYVARAKNTIDGEWTPGKAGHHLSGCYIPYQGKEFGLVSYEILTSNSPFDYEWRNCSSGNFPDKDKAVCVSPDFGYYVSRGIHEGSLIPGKFIDYPRINSVSYGGKEFKADRYDILYKIPRESVSGPEVKFDMKLTKYQPLFHDMNIHLMKGISYLTQYAVNFKSALDEGHTDFNVIIKIIENELYPIVKMANVEITGMHNIADNLVGSLNIDVEVCENTLQERKHNINKLEEELNELKVKLEGRSKDVQTAKEKKKRKEDDFDKAKEALSDAESKLAQAEEERKNAKIAGGLLFLLGPIGWLAGAITLTVDATVLKKERDLCKTNKDTTLSELS